MFIRRSRHGSQRINFCRIQKTGACRIIKSVMNTRIRIPTQINGAVRFGGSAGSEAGRVSGRGCLRRKRDGDYDQKRGEKIFSH